MPSCDPHPTPSRAGRSALWPPLRGQTLKETPHERRLVLRDPPDPRRPDPRPHDRRARAADLPDDVVRLPGRAGRRRPLRAQGPRPDLHAHRQPDHHGRRGPDRLARGRRRRPAARVGLGRHHARDPQHRRGRRPHRREPEPVRRHVQPAALHTAEARRDDDLRHRPARPAGLARRDPAEHQAAVRRDDPEPALGHPRHRGRRRRRPHGRCTAGRRQHDRHAVPHPPDRVRRRRRHPLGNQVPRRARLGDRGRHRRRRHVRLRAAPRPVPELQHAGRQLPRACLRPRPRRRERVRREPLLHPQGARAAAARPRTGDLAVQLVPHRPGHRDAVAAHRAARGERAEGRGVARGP